MISVKGKDFYLGDKSYASIPDSRIERDCVVFCNNYGDARITKDDKGLYVEVNNKYDKRFKSMRLLAQWLNKNSYRFLGYDNRW